MRDRAGQGPRPRAPVGAHELAVSLHGPAEDGGGDAVDDFDTADSLKASVGSSRSDPLRQRSAAAGHLCPGAGRADGVEEGRPGLSTTNGKDLVSICWFCRPASPPTDM